MRYTGVANTVLVFSLFSSVLVFASFCFVFVLFS